VLIRRSRMAAGSSRLPRNAARHQSLTANRASKLGLMRCVGFRGGIGASAIPPRRDGGGNSFRGAITSAGGGRIQASRVSPALRLLPVVRIARGLLGR
jgi:hypothetical protein